MPLETEARAQLATRNWQAIMSESPLHVADFYPKHPNIAILRQCYIEGFKYLYWNITGLGNWQLL